MSSFDLHPQSTLKNILEPRQSSIKSIYICLRHAEPDANPAIHALGAVPVSNDLYGSDVISAFEASKRYTRPTKSEVPACSC